MPESPTGSELVVRPRQYHRFTPDRQQVCLQALEMGYTRTAACAAAGITKDTFYRWMGNQTDLTILGDASEALTFAMRVEQAEARAQGRAETIIVSKIPSDPSVAWRWLRRHRREDWGDPEQEERIKEIQGRIELARMELELARLERELLDIELEKAQGGEDKHGSEDADQEHEAGAGTEPEASPEETPSIELEYVEHRPPEDSDPEAP